ncbi:hypothetical protein D0T56_07340 [Dysgonomonas sp. 520]|nr:hypothetical protein [Dysgonomonas sp. 520]
MCSSFSVKQKYRLKSLIDILSLINYANQYLTNVGLNSTFFGWSRGQGSALPESRRVKFYARKEKYMRANVYSPLHNIENKPTLLL